MQVQSANSEYSELRSFTNKIVIMNCELKVNPRSIKSQKIREARKQIVQDYIKRAASSSKQKEVQFQEFDAYIDTIPLDYNNSINDTHQLTELISLYGSDFKKLTRNQRKYIFENQKEIIRITKSRENRLKQTNLSRTDAKKNGVTIVEFFIHPNGSLSEIKVIESSKIWLFDDTAKEIIEYSHIRYPRPIEKTLIRYKIVYGSNY